jgi:hypothetical protein
MDTGFFLRQYGYWKFGRVVLVSMLGQSPAASAGFYCNSMLGQSPAASAGIYCNVIAVFASVSYI